MSVSHRTVHKASSEFCGRKSWGFYAAAVGRIQGSDGKDELVTTVT